MKKIFKKENFKKISTIIMIAFILSLYWVEFSAWSSRALAKYNNGYGTFDMKFYNAQIVYKILNLTRLEGFHIYKMYLVGDSLFILSFGALQILITYLIFHNHRFSVLKQVMTIPILRGFFDMIENIILAFVINTYPTKHEILVTVASVSTRLKLAMIWLWLVIILTLSRKFTAS